MNSSTCARVKALIHSADTPWECQKIQEQLETLASRAKQKREKLEETLRQEGLNYKDLREHQIKKIRLSPLPVIKVPNTQFFREEVLMREKIENPGSRINSILCSLLIWKKPSSPNAHTIPSLVS